MLGDLIHNALEVVGITEDRVRRWLGDCCCRERRERLNALDAWARRVLSGKVKNADTHLKQMIGDSCNRNP